MKSRVLSRDVLGDTQNRNAYIFIAICALFKNLQCLNFSSSYDYEQLTFTRSTPTNFSSNLLELHVVVKTIDDCLCLLDGQLNQMHTFYVTIRPRGVCDSELVGNHVSYSLISFFQ
jgi:hypothetical protein